MIGQKMQLLPSARYEYSFGEYETVTEKGSHEYLHLSPAFHIRYEPFSDIIITASFARHISRPAFMSSVPVRKIKIKKDLVEVGNPEITPAVSNGMDMKGSWYFNSSSYISLSAYYKNVKDMIEMKSVGIDEETGYNLITFVNVDTARLFGFYIDTRIDPGENSYSGFTFSFSYSFLGSSVRDDLSGEIRRINNQPAHLIAARIDYLDTERKFNISANINYNTKRTIASFLSDDTIIPETTEKGFFQLAARIKYYIKPGGSIYLSGDNLLKPSSVITQGTVTETVRTGMILKMGLTYSFR
jgi:outer membrane receptor protein involved in Fe transport